MIVEMEVVEEVVVREFAERGEPVPHAKAYRVHIDGEVIRFETSSPTGETLLKAIDKCACAFELIAEFMRHENEVIEPDEAVDLRRPGLKGYITAHKEIVTIFIGGKPYGMERGERSVDSILSKVGQTAAGYDLYDEKTGLPLSSDRPVKIHGCEEFITQVRGGASS